MDVEDLFDLDTVLFQKRKCRSCGKSKDLTTDFYRSRPDRTSLSAWSYECKDCTKKRVKSKKRNQREDVYPDWQWVRAWFPQLKVPKI